MPKLSSLIAYWKTIKAFVLHQLGFGLIRFGLMLIPAIGMLLIIIFNGVSVPYYDEFSNPFRVLTLDYTGQLTSAELLRQFNDSRKLISNAIFILFLRIFGYWNIKFQLYFTWSLGVIIVILLSILITRTARSSHPSYRWLSLLTLVSMSALIFSFTAYYRWLWGITLHRVIPDFCAVLSAVIITLNYRNITKSLALATCATIALFSFSGGIIVSLINLGLLFSIQHIKRFHILTYLVIVSISIFNFLDGYKMRSGTAIASYLYSFSQFPEDFSFVMKFLGNPFSNQGNQAFTLGFMLFNAFGICTLTGLFSCHHPNQKTSEHLHKSLIPWVAIGNYAILCGAVMAYFRADENLVSPLDLRYILHANYLAIALLGIMLVWGTHHNQKLVIFFNPLNFYKVFSKERKITQTLIIYLLSIVYLTLGAFFVRYNFMTYPAIHIHKYNLLYGKSCLQLNPYLEDKSCFRSIFPRPNIPQFSEKLIKIRDLEILRPGILNLKNYRHFQMYVNQNVNQTPIALGQLEKVQRLDNGRLQITGFSLLPATLRPADAIVIIDPERSQAMDQLIIVTIGKSGLLRSDLRQHLGSRYQYAGWTVEMAAPAKSLSRFEFFAFDAEKNQFFRIENKLSL